MFKIQQDGNVLVTIKNIITEGNYEKLYPLKNSLFKDFSMEEIQVEMIKEVIMAFRFLLRKNHEYTMEEFAKIISDNYDLEGKVSWMCEFLLGIKEKG